MKLKVNRMKTQRYMNSALAIALAAAIGLNFTRPVHATEGTGGDRTTGFFVGKIDDIDLKTRMLKIKNESSEMTFRVAEDAQIFGRDNKEISLSDLKTGDEVTVDYAQEDSVMVAHRITLTEKPLPPPPNGDRPLRF